MMRRIFFSLFVILAILWGGLVSLRLTFALSTTGSILTISSLPEDLVAAEHLRVALKAVVNRDSKIELISEGTTDSYAAARLLKDHYSVSNIPAVAVIRWTRSGIIPAHLLSGSYRLVTLGLERPVDIHIVTRRSSHIYISLDAHSRRSLEGKSFGIGWKDTPTEEDALNVFKALGEYPCPVRSKCQTIPFDEQADKLLNKEIDVYFLSGTCPNPQVQFVQEQLGADFYLAPIPQEVVKSMASQNDRPYVVDMFDPRKCDYPMQQGVIETAGVARSVVGLANVDKQVALDVAKALVNMPPFSRDSFGDALQKLNNSFPVDDATRQVYKKWLK